MKITDLITELEKYYKAFGDLDVAVECRNNKGNLTDHYDCDVDVNVYERNGIDSEKLIQSQEHTGTDKILII